MAGPQTGLTQQWLNQNFPLLAGLAPLGQGGQKFVLSADHPVHGPVVLKLIPPNQDVEALRREILAVRQIQSPRVPEILEDGSVQSQLGLCFWILERRVTGQTVRDMLNQGSLQPQELLRLGLHVLEALVLAERVEIVHRDVKPDNIIRDAAGAYWLLDFGLARHLSLDSMTATALPFGKVTWGYSPPEQCRNIKPAIDARADLFALGVTLIECATGVNPFRTGARNAVEILHRVETQVLPPILLPIAQASNFRDLVAAMTQRRLDHRPQTAADALEWMREVCAAEGIQ